MRVCTSDGDVLTRIYGSGIAFPTSTTDGMIKTNYAKLEYRADGFRLYCNTVANKILNGILVKDQLINISKRDYRSQNRAKSWHIDSSQSLE